MRLAIIADVHGNLVALEAVLADIARFAPDLLVNLGDLVSGPFDPAGSAAAQMALNCPTLAGNHERGLTENGANGLDALARPLLSPDQMDWIAALPATLTLLDGAVFACHGSPAGGDEEYLLEDMSTGRPRLDTEAAIAARLAGAGAAQVVLCGHSHVARMATIGGVLVLNPGSVGMPGYRAALPVPHVVEAGAPHARYALLERGHAGWHARFQAVPYDAETAARQAERHGRPAIAHSVRTGWMPPA